MVHGQYKERYLPYWPIYDKYIDPVNRKKLSLVTASALSTHRDYIGRYSHSYYEMKQHGAIFTTIHMETIPTLTIQKHSKNCHNQAHTISIPIQYPGHDMYKLCELFMIIHLYSI